jgi:hypothetical protein
MPDRAPPRVWTWFVVYCVVMALQYLAVFGLGVFFFLAPSDPGLGPNERLLFGGLYVGFGLVFGIPFTIAPFLPHNRGTWVYGIVLIALGMTGLCYLPFTIPLLIFWLKPETRAHFGYETYLRIPLPWAEETFGERDFGGYRGAGDQVQRRPGESRGSTGISDSPARPSSRGRPEPEDED